MNYTNDIDHCRARSESDHLCDLLFDKLPPEQAEAATCSVRNHCISLETLNSLSKEEMMEVFPSMGIRKSVMQLIVDKVSQRPARSSCHHMIMYTDSFTFF